MEELGQAIIRSHCAILLGMSKDHKEFPRPATVGERRHWLHELESNEEHENAEEQSDTESLNQVEVTKRKEGLQEKVIIDCMLRKHRVRRFAPDFDQSINAKDNKFLWNLAVKILVKSVECGEYVGVSLVETPEVVIATQLRKHVKDCLTKKYICLIPN